jgi:hypothetical protein
MEGKKMRLKLTRYFLGFLLFCFLASGFVMASPDGPVTADSLAVIKNPDFIDMQNDSWWVKSNLQYVNENGVDTMSWWGNNPYGPCGMDKGWWGDAVVSQTITLPSDVSTLRWNVCPSCWYAADGTGAYSPNARVSIRINDSYLVNHATPPAGMPTLEYDISPYASQTIKLDLILNGDCNEWANVFSNWVDLTYVAPGIAWQRPYGGNRDDSLNDIEPTSDGGYIMTGSTSSNNGDISNKHGGWDAWIAKLNPPLHGRNLSAAAGMTTGSG